MRFHSKPSSLSVVELCDDAWDGHRHMFSNIRESYDLANGLEEWLRREGDVENIEKLGLGTIAMTILYTLLKACWARNVAVRPCPMGIWR